MTAARHIEVGAREDEWSFYEGLVNEFGSPLLIYDSSIVQRQHSRLSRALRGVFLYYAVKAHPHEQIVLTLNELGCGFDVASVGETDMLLQLKIFGRQTIHTHPIKTDAEIRSSLRFGATTFVVDNLYELEKLIPYRSRVGVLLRVSFRSQGAVVDLSKKFGCDPGEALLVIEAARARGVHIKGLSFHVGSQCADASKHVQAIRACRDLMLRANDSGFAPLHVLDIGGGFPADYQRTGCRIEEFCRPIREALAALPTDWEVIAEPGRILVAPAVRSITSVIGKSIRNGVRWYYLDDGVYGSYSGQVFDHACYPLQVLKAGELHCSVLAGPTCDSIDLVAEDILLPDLEPGDLVIGHEMGAYTAATRTRFNSLPDAKFVCLKSERSAVDSRV